VLPRYSIKLISRKCFNSTFTTNLHLPHVDMTLLYRGIFTASCVHWN